MRVRALGSQVGEARSDLSFRSPRLSSQFRDTAENPLCGVGGERFELVRRDRPGVGAEPQQEPFEPGRLADREDDLERAVRALRDRLGRVRLGDPCRGRRELERDPGVVGAGGVDVAGLEPGRARLEVSRRSGTTVRMRSTRNMRSSLARWQYAPTYHSPVAKNDDLGIDAARRQLVAAGRPVFDLDASVRVDGVADRFEVCRLADVDHEPGELERVLQLGERGRERAVRIANPARRAARVRPRAGRDLRRA